MLIITWAGQVALSDCQITFSHISSVDPQRAMSVCHLVGPILRFRTKISPQLLDVRGIQFSTDIHGLQMMNPTDVSSPLTFLLAPPCG